MKAESITIYGLLYSCDCTIELSDTALTFIYSRNGFGKTTSLKTLISAMKGDIKTLETLPFDRMDAKFSDGITLIVEKRDGISMLIQKNELEQPVDEAELRKLFRVTYIPPERQTVRRKDGHLVPAVIVYATELRDRVRYAKENSELKRPAGGECPEMSDGQMVSVFKDLKAKLDYMKGAGLEPDMPGSLRFPPTHRDVANKRDEYRDLLYGLEDYIGRSYKLSESVVVMMDILNGLFHGKSLLINEKDDLVFRLDSGEDLPLSALSSGEKNMLIIMYRLLFQTADGSVVVIDEPENSLHIEWQQKIGDVFSDIARLRDLQFLVATHSPQIIHDKWDVARELRDLNAGSTDAGRRCE